MPRMHCIVQKGFSCRKKKGKKKRKWRELKCSAWIKGKENFVYVYHLSVSYLACCLCGERCAGLGTLPPDSASLQQPASRSPKNVEIYSEAPETDPNVGSAGRI